MDLAGILKSVDEILEDPLRSRLRSFWVGHGNVTETIHFGEMTMLSGVVYKCELDCFSLSPSTFHPWRGFVSEDDSNLCIQIQVDQLSARQPKVCDGDSITIYGKALWRDSAYVFENDAVVTHRACVAPSLPFHALHLFSGGFMGWSRAFEVLSRTALEISTGNQIFVDHDPKVMECCAKTNGLIVHEGPSKPRRSPVFQKIGICTDVGDKSLCHHVSYLDNLICTMSPPCISWSRGGRGRGLMCDAGFAFQEAIEIISITQPLAVFGECADLTPSHPHFPLLDASFRVLGYKCIWHQVVPMHTLSHNMRTRWLFAWTRNDVPASFVHSVFELRAPPLTPWHSHLNQLWIPEAMREQLILQPSLLEIYSDVALMPASKRPKQDRQATQQSKLRSRLANCGEPFPTLCSSYGTQHLLNRSHILSKGIFASLLETNGIFSFVDPLRFVPMFGATSKCLIPCEVADAFLFLGNAITVPHALLALCVGLGSILQCEINHVAEVATCWRARLHSGQSVVQFIDDYVEVWPWSDFCQQIACRDVDFQCGFMVHVEPSYATKKTITIPVDFTAHDFAEHAFAFQKHLLPDITACRVPDEPASPSLTMGQLQRASLDWDLYFRNSLVARLHFEPPCFDRALVPPTLPYDIEDECPDVVEVPNQPHFLDSPNCGGALSLLEYCLGFDFRHRTSYSCLVSWEDPPVLLECKTTSAPLEFLERFLQQSHLGASFAVHEACRLISQPNTPHFLVASVDDTLKPLVIVECCASCTVTQPLRLVESLETNTCVVFRGLHSVITHHNGNRVHSDTCLSLNHADVVSVSPCAHDIRVGGHPDAACIPPLNANATFEQRCEWAVNTFGWAATDELQFAFDAMNLPSHVITYLGYWNKQRQCIENGPFGNLELNNEGETWCAILCDNHWISADVSKHGDRASINIRGAPEDVARAVAHEIARRLDLNPLRVPFSHGSLLAADNMCGWDALLFWHSAAGNEPHVFPDFAGLYRLASDTQDHIWHVMHASWEEWQKTNAAVKLRNFAWVTRFNFFVHLATINRSQLATHCGPVIATTEPRPSSTASGSIQPPPMSCP